MAYMGRIQKMVLMTVVETRSEMAGVPFATIVLPTAVMMLALI